MMKWLCVAEKPSVAKTLTEMLSGGQWNTRNARAPRFIKNYDFSYRMGPGPGHTSMTMTAVAGHLTSNDFDGDYKGWHSCEPQTLFDVHVRTFVTQSPEMLGIEANLTAEAKKATHLMIWTDCDREGEYIGSIVADVCRKANRAIVVKRAIFSQMTTPAVNHACRNPVELNRRHAQAVATRMELDLKVGAVFTRMQCLELQKRVPMLADKLISYGPCQFPTLGFVVDQYERHMSFVAETFWYIHVAVGRNGLDTSFTWRRGRLFDYDVADALYSICEAEPEATVLSQTTKPKNRWKPLPLTTVELQKVGSRILHMTPKRALETAEGLYQRGILSYPRTETDQFDQGFNFHELIEKHRNDHQWGGFANQLLDDGGFQRPRNGQRNDKAHPPIHPTAHVNNLAGDEKKVYDFIVRRFLACCSQAAKGFEKTVEIEIAEEKFKATGLTVTERNYLDVYVYDKWADCVLPDFQPGEHFIPDELGLKEGQTTQPKLLTEADLVELMDNNGIGTDATIAEHISKVIERQFVVKMVRGENKDRLVPSKLGAALVKAYDEVGLDTSLTKPHLRRQTEERLKQICDGAKLKGDVIMQTLDEYRDVYHRTRQQLALFVEIVREYVERQPEGEGGNDDDNGGGHGGGGGGSDDEDDEDDDDGGGVGNVGRGRGAGRGRGGAARGRGSGSGTGGAARGKGRGVAAPKRKKKDEDDDDDDSPDSPACTCGTPSVQRTVGKEGPNKGRLFFSCSKPREESCGFFEWADEAAGRVVPQKRPAANKSNTARYSSRDAAAGVDALRCECDLTPQQLTVSKEGANQGRTFLKCPNVSKNAQCGFFAWADEAGGASAPRAGGGGGGGGGGGPSGQGSCFNCNQDGHWASQCPQPRANAGGAGGGGGFGGGGATGECFICHESGHFANACPQKGQGGVGGRGGGGGGGSGGGGSNLSCFKCGEQGHFSNACTNAGASGSTSRRGRGRGSRGGGSSRGRGRGRGRKSYD